MVTISETMPKVKGRTIIPLEGNELKLKQHLQESISTLEEDKYPYEAYVAWLSHEQSKGPLTRQTLLGNDSLRAALSNLGLLYEPPVPTNDLHASVGGMVYQTLGGKSYLDHTLYPGRITLCVIDENLNRTEILTRSDGPNPEDVFVGLYINYSYSNLQPLASSGLRAC